MPTAPAIGICRALAGIIGFSAMVASRPAKHHGQRRERPAAQQGSGSHQSADKRREGPHDLGASSPPGHAHGSDRSRRAAPGRLPAGIRPRATAAPCRWVHGPMRRAPGLRHLVAMSMLELRQVSKVYGQGAAEVHALREVNLEVAPGTMVAVMGPSGSGKSTLLTIAGSLEEPTSGQVLVAGQDLATMSRNGKARLRRRSIGYVFQDFNLLPGLTAAENVALPLELDGVSARKAREAGLRALDALGLADRASNYPDQLSGGERQRVAIARAVVGDRHLLLADEPSGALDSANGEAVMRMIRTACQRGIAAVVVTHDAQLASWADRVVLIRDGRIVDQPAPAPGPESLAGAGPVSTLHPPARGDRQRGRPRPARGVPLGLAAVPPRMAPAAARARPAHRGGRRDDLGRQRGHEHAAPEPGLRHVRHRGRAGHAARHRPAPGRRHRRHRRPLGPGRSHRESGHRDGHHPACAAARRESARALQLPAAQPGQRYLPGRARSGRADQPGRGPVRRACGRHLAGRRDDLAGDRHRGRTRATWPTSSRWPPRARSRTPAR